MVSITLSIPEATINDDDGNIESIYTVIFCYMIISYIKRKDIIYDGMKKDYWF